MRRNELLFAVIGGTVGAILTMAAGLVLPLEAQNEAAVVRFGTIVCRKLVVDSPVNGRRVVIHSDSPFGEDEPLVTIAGSQGVVLLGATKRQEGGKVFLEAYDKDLDQPYIRLGALKVNERVSYSGYAAVFGEGEEMNALLTR